MILEAPHRQHRFGVGSKPPAEDNLKKIFDDIKALRDRLNKLSGQGITENRVIGQAISALDDAADTIEDVLPAA